MRHRAPFLCSLFVVAAALLGLVACSGGGGNPAAPSPEEGIVVRGSVAGGASALSGASSAAVVTVRVSGHPEIKTTVGADGSFTLRGLPEGSFVLIFSNEKGEIGRLRFDGVAPNQEITITVSITSSDVILLDEHRNGIGHGDVEIEARVTAVLQLNARGDSVFVIGGYTVVARPGQTTIRKGNSPRTVSDVTVGKQVHVKGEWLPSVSAQSQRVLALEIKLQGGSDPGSGGGGGGGGNGGGQSQCVAAGAKAEVEGIITGKDASSITVFQQGKGDYRCFANGDTRIRKGNTTYSFDQLQSGWRVHVKGQGLGASGGACQVDADEIKVQQN
jgi:hypothetical protein